MEWLLPIILNYYAANAICFYFLGRFCSRRVSWFWVLTFPMICVALSLMKETLSLLGIAAIVIQVTPFIIYGILFVKLKSIAAITLSVLLVSILHVLQGLVFSLTYVIVSGLDGDSLLILKYIDLVGNSLCIVLLLISLQMIYRTFHGRLDSLHNSALLLLGLPVLFISMVEKIISSEIYGSTFVWDTDIGLISPKVNAAELCILQVFAVIGLFTVIAAFHRLDNVIQNEQTIKLMAQQTHHQEVYVQEAQARYKQTRAFRHDIKNHLLILKKLLKEGNNSEAYLYLSNLDKMSDSLSLPVHTGTPVVDALLGSKLAIALQNEITVDCSIKIPESCLIKDIDWCILLSNAVDNAINANLLIPADKRYLRLLGKQKGNFYLIYLENCCQKTEETPAYGIGLSNMKTTVEQYNGTMDIVISGDIFKLNILLLIPQH